MNPFCALECSLGDIWGGNVSVELRKMSFCFCGFFAPKAPWILWKTIYHTRILSLLSFFCKMYTLKAVHCVALSQAETSFVNIIFRTLTETENLAASAFRSMASCLRRMCLHSSKPGSKRWNVFTIAVVWHAPPMSRQDSVLQAAVVRELGVELFRWFFKVTNLSL